ncbi:MAG: peptidase S8, partial [Clostridiaceae bacterium]
YGDRLKYFMLKGAKRGRIDTIYPDATWGYGELCLRGGMELAVQRGARSKGLRQECSELFYEENYSNYIVEYEGDVKSAFTNIDYACGFILDDRYAVVSVDINK